MRFSTASTYTVMPIRQLFVLAVMFIASNAFAQGQDSATYDRDLQVIDAILPGKYANANQAYFDVRGDRQVKHVGFTVDIEPAVAADGSEGYLASMQRGDGAPRLEYWALSPDASANAVRMRAWHLDDRMQLADPAFTTKGACDVHWRREAAQLRATAAADCLAGYAAELVLSERQLWMNYPEERAGDFQMHRARPFECYADVPGVGGGRDEAYERYGGFPVHDQGGSAWFTSKEGRRLGISLFLVDWPINNYVGIFTRDSLVVYVNEEVGGERKQHGYAFTLPEADRVGINLKWILVNCYMESNEVATPTM